MDNLIIFLANYLIFIELGLAAGILLRLPRRRWPKTLLLIILTGLFALLFAHLGALLFYDTRPFVRDHIQPLVMGGKDNGFPSDHMLVASVAASLIFLVNKRYGFVLWILAILVGVGRILAHVHSPIDVIGSAAMAIVAAWLALKCTHYIRLGWQRKTKS